MNVAVSLAASFEGSPFTYGGLLRVPWNVKKTKLDGKLELADNPGLNRAKINNFKIAVRFYDLSHSIDFGQVNGKDMQEWVVECYVEMQATNLMTTEVQVLNRWPSNLGDNYVDSGNQYPVETIARVIPTPRARQNAPKAGSTPKSGKRK